MDANLRLVGFNAEEDFDAIVSADLFERLKPAPDIFLAAARELGTDPANCVVVEDAAAGVTAARLAGERAALPAKCCIYITMGSLQHFSQVALCFASALPDRFSPSELVTVRCRALDGAALLLADRGNLFVQG